MKATRKATNARELFHHWANQSRDEERCGNVFYDGATCYSYGRHFPIATIKTLADGSRVTLFNPDGYSSSTSKHKAYARCAAHGELHHINKREWEGITDRATLTTALEKQAVENAASAEAAKEAKREQARAARQRAKLAKMSLPERVVKWRAFENGMLSNADPVFLRVSKDGADVETSRGARVSVRAAKRAWPLILSRAEDPHFEWGAYKGITLHQNGVLSLVVGCHQIPMEQVEFIARKLELTA